MAASEDKLGALHEAVTRALIEGVTPTVIPGVEGEADVVLPPSAAMLAAAAKFLKDNSISCAPSEDNEMGELQRRLEEKNDRRTARKAERAELLEAGREAGFLRGLN